VDIGEMVGQVGGLRELLKHARLRFGQILTDFGSDDDEEEQLEGERPRSARTEIRSAIDSARDGLAEIDRILAEVDKLAEDSK
jgi:hypothetical protein